MLFDSHCHFTDEGFDGTREELAEQIKASELARIVDIGTDLETSLKAARAAEVYEFCWAAVGYHPAEVVDQAACIGCASCARTCPDVAIRIEKE